MLRLLKKASSMITQIPAWDAGNPNLLSSMIAESTEELIKKFLWEPVPWNPHHICVFSEHAMQYDSQIFMWDQNRPNYQLIKLTSSAYAQIG